MTSDTDTILAAYIECALWSSHDWADDDGGEPMDNNHGPEDLAPETVETMRAEIADFIRYAETERPDVFAGMDPGQIGHDFWLTRNHHGAGFWDRGLGEIGEYLTKAAHSFGDADLYVGDDGKVYQQ